MSKLRKTKGMGILIGIIVAVCVIITFLIVARLTVQTMKRNHLQIGTEELDKDEELTLENVYITNCGNGEISFLYDAEVYTIPGNLEEPYQGIADIQIKNLKIQRIYTKQDAIEGVLLSYTDKQIEVEGYGMLPCEENLRVYLDYGNDIREITFSELVVGSSKLQFIVANDEICGVIQKEKTRAANIRVLIKNGDADFYDQICLTGNANWNIDSTEQAANCAVNVTQYMDDNSLQTAAIACEEGLLYLSDANGNPVSNGYEGVFYVKRTGDGFVLINELPVEDYVRYVLPSEMPDTFSAEALKAQAVCARTFAYSQMKNDIYAAYGANLDDSTAFQVYNAAGTSEITDQAVSDTTGEVIACNGELIICYYYSTSPGLTEDMEVWQEDAPEYIKKQNTLSGEVTDVSSEEAFTEFICSQPEAYDSQSPFYRWTANIDFANAADESYGTLKEILVSDRSTSGYVLGLTLSYENGSRRLENENEIRLFLGRYLTEITLADGTVRTNFSMIPSACFAITDQDGTKLTLTGGGFGHGIGMSQYGADAMGQEGKSYQEIIKCYYENVNIVQIGNLTY